MQTVFKQQQPQCEHAAASIPTRHPEDVGHVREIDLAGRPGRLVGGGRPDVPVDDVDMAVRGDTEPSE